MCSFCFYKETDLFKINDSFSTDHNVTGILAWILFLSSRLMYLLHFFYKVKLWTDRGRQRLLAQREHTDSTCCQRAVRNTGKERYTHHKETFRERFWPRSTYPNLIWLTDRHNSSLKEYSTHINDLNWCLATWKAGELIIRCSQTHVHE